jgi:chromodomain-helicase-DNA-binding protein 7
MGLGKTIQAMAFLNHLFYQENMSGPFLILAPLSTLAHWKKSFDDWSYMNSVCYYDEDGKAGREYCRS